MKKILSLFRNKWRQYTNRMFFSDTNNNQLWYKNLSVGLLNLDEYFNKRLKFGQPSIVMVSDNLLAKILVFMYSFITNVNLVLISPKFHPSAIVNAIVSRTGFNILIIDKEIENKIIAYEEEEGIRILKYFSHVETTMKLLEVATAPLHELSEVCFNRLYKKGLRNIYSNFEILPKLSVLSPGTSAAPCFTNIPYEILAKSMQMMSYFMGLKTTDKVSVIADFEFFPGVFSLLPLLNGSQLIQPTEDVQSAEDLIEQFKQSKIKPTVVIISSFKFKLIWDSILLKVYSNKLLYKLSKWSLLAWITKRVVRREIVRTFGKDVKKIHILNEELGVYCLNVLKQSKIFFTSSYGYLEQGNFLAFKDPILFKDKHFYAKPGGSTLIPTPELFEQIGLNEKNWTFTSTDKMIVGEIKVETTVGCVSRVMLSEDWGTFIDNVSSQGKRKYLYILGRKCRNGINNATSLELIEKFIKDDLLIRDCLFIKFREGCYNMYIEPREDLLEIQHIEWSEVEAKISALAKELKDKGTINIDTWSILRFNGLRNIAGKIQYYNSL